MNSKASDLVALVGDGPHSRILVHALLKRFGPFPILIEQGEDPAVFWQRRRRRLGLLKSLSLRWAAFPQTFVKLFSRQRVREILREEGVDASPLPAELVTRVSSVNADETLEQLLGMQPKVVFVCSTRMIKPPLLSGVNAAFINYHSGINPGYRGLYGGYHALAEGEPHRFGTTVHLVDEGVDTGAVLATQVVKATRRDSVHTYIQLMAAQSRTTVCKTIARALKGDLRPEPQPPMPSRLWHGPGVFSYIRTGLVRGVW